MGGIKSLRFGVLGYMDRVRRFVLLPLDRALAAD
jgi:hypothetical protein